MSRVELSRCSKCLTEKHLRPLSTICSICRRNEKRQRKRKMKSLALFLLLPVVALATDKPVQIAPPIAISESQAYSNAASASNSNSSSSSVGAAESNNSIYAPEYHPRQTPGMAQGSFAIQGCQVAGNAGGSGTGATGFLGFGFTPSQCYDYMLAQAYAAVGERNAACLVLNSTKAAKRAQKRGVTLPACTATQAPVPTQTASTAPAVSVPAKAECASKTELRETVDRAFRCKQEGEK